MLPTVCPGPRPLLTHRQIAPASPVACSRGDRFSSQVWRRRPGRTRLAAPLRLPGPRRHGDAGRPSLTRNVRPSARCQLSDPSLDRLEESRVPRLGSAELAVSPALSPWSGPASAHLRGKASGGHSDAPTKTRGTGVGVWVSAQRHRPALPARSWRAPRADRARCPCLSPTAAWPTRGPHKNTEGPSPV